MMKKGFSTSYIWFGCWWVLVCCKEDPTICVPVERYCNTVADCSGASDEADSGCTCENLKMHQCFLAGSPVCFYKDWLINTHLNITHCEESVLLTSKEGLNIGQHIQVGIKVLHFLPAVPYPDAIQPHYIIVNMVVLKWKMNISCKFIPYQGQNQTTLYIDSHFKIVHFQQCYKKCMISIF